MAFCANCGATVDGRFCQKCGAPAGVPGAAPPPVAETYPPGAQPLPPPQVATSVTMNDNMASALCYLLGFITGILFLVLAPYNQNRNIRFHAFQSIFLNIAWFAAYIVVSIISLAFRAIPILGELVYVVLHLSLALAALVLWLYLMFKAYNGEKIVLPLVGPLADKQAGV
jgi:uncharacterized membrane protein